MAALIDKTGLFSYTDESVHKASRKKKRTHTDSLEGCEIPKRISDCSDLDNFELVSIEL